MNVLVADDIDLVREKLIGIFSKIEGLGVILEASNGLEARDMIVVEKPEEVVVELRMPRWNSLGCFQPLGVPRSAGTRG